MFKYDGLNLVIISEDSKLCIKCGSGLQNGQYINLNLN